MSRTHLWKTLALQLKTSPGKAGILGFLTLVLVALIVRQLLGGPHSAEAVQINTALIPETGARPGLERPVAPARKPRRSLPSLPNRASRDLFEVDWSLFARVARANVEVQRDEADDPPEVAAELALELTLTSSTEGGEPYAVINGESVRLGDAIGTFVIESISPGTVILSAKGRERIALRMR